MRGDERDDETIWSRHQEKTFNRPPHDILLRALNYFGKFSGYAIDLGCGAGMDTMELIRKGWEVLAIDNNPYSFEKIKLKLDEKQLDKLETRKGKFEELEFPQAHLINASFSIPFCRPESFNRLWENIVEAINSNGRFSGNFLGDKDGWGYREEMSFFNKQEILELLKGFTIEYFEEKEYDGKTTQGNIKHWHVFNVIAKKNEEGEQNGTRI